MFTEIERAILFAAKAHGYQSRKSIDVPMIYHPLTVGVILMENNCRDEVVMAGFLHDVLEDTTTTYDDLLNSFGQEIADMVSDASEPDKTLSWTERKAHTIEHLKIVPLDSKLVSCADKIHNLSSTYEVLSHDIDVWSHFKEGKEKQQWYYEEVLKSYRFNGDNDPMFDRLESIIKIVFPNPISQKVFIK